MTREVASLPGRQTMLAMFAAVAFFGAVSIAQAQSTTTSPSTTSPSSSSTTTAQNRSATTGSPTQVNPNARDSNRQASQGMVPSANEPSAQSRIDAPDSDLRNDRNAARNDRTTMARAPRADRN
ncbi:MAG: hypothetical protein LT102_11440 [Burkholderiaceae bacterium]|nr:hypothetical protein [Burkholderiaceae bacterium]